MNLGIFGGTFDPPHVAHAMAVLWALQSGAVDRVLVIPAARHAFGKEPGASFAQRMEMCRIAFADFAPGFVEISDIEDRREGPSYMVDTLRAVQRERAGDALRLIVGTDIVDDLPKWREGGEVQRLAPPLVVPRIVTMDPHPDLGPRPGALPLLSSTIVRGLLARRGDTTGLVSAAVRAFIEAHRLYLVQPPA